MCACTCMHAHRSELVCTYAHSRVCSHIHTRACTYRHAHRSELMCVHMHTHVYALTYTHVCAHTGMPTGVSSGVPMCTLSCLHSHVHTYACTQMHNYRCALRCTHVHTHTHALSCAPCPCSSWPMAQCQPLCHGPGTRGGCSRSRAPTTHVATGRIHPHPPAGTSNQHLLRRGHSHTQVLLTSSFFSMPSTPLLLLLFSCSVV